MDSPLKVIVEVPGNPNYRWIHLKAEISSASYLHLVKNWPRNLIRGEPGSIGEAIVHKMFAIAGITEIGLSPYELSIHKAMAFDWDELLPQVLDVIRQVLNCGELDVTYTNMEVPASVSRQIDSDLDWTSFDDGLDL